MKNIRISVLSLFLIFTLTSLAQDTEEKWMYLWNGLRTNQPEAEMPKGKAPFQTSQRKAKVNKPARFIPSTLSKFVSTDQGEWIISDGWEMSPSAPLIEKGISLFDPQLNTSEWYNATVPGTVLTTLVDQGVYPDPYFGLNNLSIPDTLCRMDWWYRIIFEKPEGIQPDGKQVRLLFNGINYRAEIFLNGKKLGNIDGAFIRGEFDVTSLYSKNGKNILAVHILPPYNPGIPHEQSMISGQGLNGGQLCLDGPTFISSEGWDWVPGIRDRNIGIWQDVRLQIGGSVQITDPQIITDVSSDLKQAEIKINSHLKNTSSSLVNGVLSAIINGKEVKQNYSLQPNETKLISLAPTDHPELIIKNPALWWPNGYGPQNLYDADIKAYTENNKISDTKKVRFGIREMSYELMVNTPEKGNTRIAYTPIEAIKDGKTLFNNIDRVKYSKEIQLPTLNKGVDLSSFEKLPDNDPVGPYLVIRVNGVRIFCRGGNWGMDDAMKRVSREHLDPYFQLQKDMNFNIIRNWTGESTEELFYELCDEYGMLVWNDFWITTEDSNVDPNDHRLFLRNATDAVRRFRNHPSIAIWCPRNEGFSPEGLETPLSNMIAQEDPTRHYHGQSRFLNMRSSGPWSYFKDPSLYYTQNAQGFNTEMGCHAIPTSHTLKKFIAPEDLWPINDVWAYHDLHHTTQAFGDFMNAVGRYGKVTGYEDFCKKSQMVTYDAWRNMLEAWNSRMWNSCTGLILWMSHPAWPSMIWQTYTYDYETPGSYFGSKKACEPVHIQMNLPDNQVIIVNTTQIAQQSVTASVRYYDINGKEFFKKQDKFNVPSNQTISCFTPDVTDLPELYLVRLELKDKKEKIISTNDYWKARNNSSYDQFNSISEAKIKVSSSRNNGIVVLTIENTSDQPAVAVKLNARDKTSGEIILPAYFSDGYFNLLPHEKRTVELDLPASVSNNYIISAEGYNQLRIEN